MQLLKVWLQLSRRWSKRGKLLLPRLRPQVLNIFLEGIFRHVSVEGIGGVWEDLSFLLGFGQQLVSGKHSAIYFVEAGRPSSREKYFERDLDLIAWVQLL